MKRRLQDRILDRLWVEIASLSNAKIHIVDLPVVTSCVSMMFDYLEISAHLIAADAITNDDYTVISNYAFSELTSELQDQYFEKWIRASKNGMMISNANLFAQSISGRSNHEIVTCEAGFGIPCGMSQ